MLVENTPSTVLVEGVSFSQTTLESACTDERNVDSLCWIRRIWSLNIGMKYPISGSAGKNRNQPSTNQVLITKPQVAEAQSRGLVGITRFFPHFRILKTEVCGKFRNPRPHSSFRTKKPQAEALACSGVISKSEFCRILPDSESLRSQY